MKALLRFLIILVIGAIAGVPFLGGIALEAWLIAEVFLWDWARVFYIQAFPVLVLGGLGVLAAALGEVVGRPLVDVEWPDWLAPRSEVER